MSSRTIIYYLYAWFFFLALNIWAYYGSDAYKDFINTLKYGSAIKVNDDISLGQEQTRTYSTGLIMTWTTTLTWSKSMTWYQLQWGTWWVSASGQTLNWATFNGTGLTLSPEEEMVINAFWDYKFKRLLVHPSLFDMTTEYPDEYYEYYSDPVTLYVFSWKSYRQIVSIFEAFATQLPFLLNKTDSFGTNSFYINLKPESQDGNIRIVFEYKQKVFWLKIRKDEYNRIRILLKNLK